MRTDDFDFDLPDDLIALRPPAERDAGRLLLVRPEHAPTFGDHMVRDLPNLLSPGDTLVLNDTKVIPAALEGVRTRGDSAVAIHANLIARVDAATWRAFARPGRRLAPGDTVTFGAAGELSATVAAKTDDGIVTFVFDRRGGDLDAAISAQGAMPLPPYIAGRRAADDDDRTRYQTVYAARDGAVAAPTAGLHLTPRLFEALAECGVATETLTLHVGAGTFLPVKTDHVADHAMHAEWGEIRADVADRLSTRRATGGRIVAVGTTVLRLLESAVDADGRIRPFTGETDIFITPGFRFRATDVLMTNFHLPRSTLFMLVAAFSGLQTIQAAYAHAIAARYRFYSYGDSSLLFRADQNKDGPGA